jgi:uncharacterized protein (TIGR03083 family)
MPRLEYPTYLDHIRTESARFRAVLTDCDPDARVPTCPDWDAADLAWHLTLVQRDWALVVRHRPTDRADIDEPEPERPGDYPELLAAFDAWSAALASELERADPDDAAWHWSGDSRVGTTYRRQAHEALIHRIDAELTAGVDVTPLDAALADDGVAEVLGVMYGGTPPWGSRELYGDRVRVRMTDTGTELHVALGRFTGTDPDDGKEYDDDDLALVEDDVAPATTISGSAADLDAWLWKRVPGLAVGWDDGARIRVEGDRATFEKLAAILDQPLN